MYKNIQVNQAVTHQGVVMPSCYVAITRAFIPNLSSLVIGIELKVYESKEKYLANSSWDRTIDECASNIEAVIDPTFTTGDMFTKTSQLVVNALILKNPSWLAENIIIEEPVV